MRQSGLQDYDAMEKQSPIYSPSNVLNQWKRSLSFVIEEPGKMIFSDTPLSPVLKAKAGAVFIYSVHPRGMPVLVIQSASPGIIDFL